VPVTSTTHSHPSLCPQGHARTDTFVRSHGVGYGEQKDVVPVIGQSTPTVRYYLPSLHRRLSVPEIELCFRRLAIDSPNDFYEKICDCTICKGVVKKELKEFSEFGEQHFSTPKSKRMA